MTDFVVNYLRKFDPRLLADPRGRRILTRLDPLAFALIYCRHHLRGDETAGRITISDFHVELCKDALAWIRPATQPRESRTAYVAPRSCGKSTWAFLILPLWAAAHKHRSFAAAFADSATQAEQHLATFRNELQSNELLRKDFPELCKAATWARSATKLSDNRSMIQQQNGFVFAAKGIDSGTLGMKVGEKRPDLIILDDIEPGEANYSAGQAEKRLSTLTHVVLPLNEYATVVAVGTVTMPGSIVHQLVRTVTTNEPPEEWIESERFTCRYFPAILTNEDGTERSIWPEKWPLEYLDSIRNTRSFKLNFLNDPAGADGDYWTADDFQYGTFDTFTYTVISVDPAVTVKESSDFTGIAVVSFSPVERKAVVRHAVQLKLTGAALRSYVLRLLSTYPETQEVRIESNQGGQLWGQILHDIPVKIVTFWSGKAKTVRAAEALGHYQRREVLHEKRLHDAEAQMIAFPKAPHDDVVDAVGAAVNYFLAPSQKRNRPRVRVLG